MATEYKLESVKNKGEIAYLYWEAEGVEGTPSKEIWTSKGFKEGTTTIGMEYSRLWQGGGKAAWIFPLTVVVT